MWFDCFWFEIENLIQIMYSNFTDTFLIEEDRNIFHLFFLNENIND